MKAIEFQTSLSITWISVFTLAVLVLVLWLEVKRKQRLLIPRLLAMCVAVLSMFSLITQPAILQTRVNTNILLTENFDPAILDSLQRKNPTAQVYKLNPDLEHPANLIPSYRALNTLTGNLFILGNGVPTYMLPYVDEAGIQFYPAIDPEGLVQLKKKRYRVNKTNYLEGEVNLKKSFRLRLLNVSNAEDSVTYKPGRHSFSLQFNPKQAGPSTYMLSALDSAGKEIWTEQIPLIVEEQQPLSILILSNYPTAEIRFLKNYLESQKHRITIRYSVSRDRYRDEFINMPVKPIRSLSSTFLNEYDLVITQTSFLNQASDNLLSDLKNSSKDGLGVLMLVDDQPVAKKVAEFSGFTFAKTATDTAQFINLGLKQKQAATSLLVSSKKELIKTLQESSGRILSGYHSHGFGKIGFQVLTNTYTLQLSGREFEYASLWSTLIDEVSRRKIKKYEVHFATPFPTYKNEPVRFSVISALEKPTVLLDSIEIPVMQHPLTKGLWMGMFWANTTGFDELLIQQDSSRHSFFVSEKDQGLSLRVENQLTAMKRLEKKNQTPLEHTSYAGLSPLIFFILFLISGGFLWLAPKL